jgi:DNA-binding beta-propeller fold protein YncE
VLPIVTFIAQPTPTEAGFARLDLAIGQEGIGPGQFTDMRHVAVDSEGRIYAAEYSSGRVQVFDQNGKFLTQWLVDDELPLVSMAANRDGLVYIVMGGEVYLHDGLTGDYQGVWNYTNEFDDVFSTLDDGLLAAHGGAQDDILRFDAGQNLDLEIPEAISGQTGDSELKMAVAEDGAGKIYALGAFNGAFFVFDAQGKFLNQIGSEGDEPGQFKAVSDIVVDGQGRIYVSDFDGVKVFMPDGRYLGLIEVEGPAFGLAIDDQDNLYVAARTQILRYSLP